MRRLRAPVLVLAAALLPLTPLLLGTQADAADGRLTTQRPPVSRPLDPAALRRVGVPGPRLPYLAGVRLNPGRGQGATITVGLPASHGARMSLIGKTPQGYAFLDTTDTGDAKQHYYNVALTGKYAGKARGFWGQDTPLGLDIYLSPDGKRILQENDGHKSGQEFTVFTTAGVKVPGFTRFVQQGNGYGILDFTGTRAFLGVKGGILDWKEGSNPATFISGVDASGADISRNLLFKAAAAGTAGPVALSTPNAAVRWSASGFDPLAVSPQGTLVLGVVSNDDGSAVVVRNRSDGTVRSSLRINRPGKSLAWEDNGHYLAVASGPSGSAVIRCNALTGTCVRATALFHGRLTLGTGVLFGSTTRS